MDLGQKNLTRVWSGQPSLVWFWVWKISPKISNFSIFFPSGLKKISSSGVKKYLGERRVGLFGSRVLSGHVRAGPISSLIMPKIKPKYFNFKLLKILLKKTISF